MSTGSFNPCFCGTGARTRSATCSFSTDAVMFQSLFLWNWRSNEAPARFTDVRLWCVSILVFVELALERNRGARCRIDGVVSILVFVELALERNGLPRCPKSLGVSILVFVELALERVQNVAILYLCCSFNPCFCGTGARTLVRPAIVTPEFLWNWRSNPNTSDHNYYSD